MGLPGPEVIKLFSRSTQLSMKFKMLINIEIAKIYGISRFKSPKQSRIFDFFGVRSIFI